MTRFDLATEPWIPVVRADGSPGEVGLKEALTGAHALREVRDPLPTVEFGLYRLLVALALDVFFAEPGANLNPNALADLLERGRFDAARVDAYFAKYADRFDLFDDARPFLQVGGMTGEDKPIAGMLPPQPSGTGVAHFHHGHEDDFAVSPAAAARLLTGIAPFMTAGGAGLSPSINGAPPYYVLLRGDTLFETVCRNLCAVPMAGAKPDGAVAWRSEREPGGSRLTGASYAESLTWRPRRVRLVPEASGGVCSLTGAPSAVLVRAMKFAAGDSCDFLWRDPNAAYRIDGREKDPAKAVKILRPRPGRDVWRDTGPLALLTDADRGSGDEKTRFERPRVLDQAAFLAREGIAAKRLRLTVYGMRTDMKMKVFEWQRETLAVPTPVVLQSAFHAEAQTAMDRAESAAYQIARAIRTAYPREGKGNDKALQSLVSYAERQFWAELRPEYDAFLERIAAAGPEDVEGLDAARAGWKDAVVGTARRVGEEAIETLDADRFALERQTLALRRLRSGLFNLFLTAEEIAERNQRRKERDRAAKKAAKATAAATK